MTFPLRSTTHALPQSAQVVLLYDYAHPMALKRPELGSLKSGCAGDASILSVKDGAFDYEDVLGEHMTGAKRIFAEGTVIAGKWWHSAKEGAFPARKGT